MSKFLSLCLIFILIALSCPSVFADQIILKNGDRLTGKIVKKDGDKIVIETESAGVVTVNWTAVERIIADEPLNIKLSDGQMLKGKVATNDEKKLNVETKDAGTVEIEKEKIELVRSDAEQLKFETEQNRMLNPSFGDLWTGSADVGLSLTSGNSNTRTFTAGIRGARATVRDKITVYANAVQASNSTLGPSITTAKAIWFGARYDYNISRKMFAFGGADFEYDKPQKLDLRAVFSAGLGYRAIRNERTQLDLFSGAAYNREYYSNGLRRNSAEILFGDELKHRINPRMLLAQRLVVFPSITNAGQFRSVLDASLLTNLNSWLGWHVTIADRYNSKPVAGAKSNDLLFSTGLRVNFGRAN